MSRLLSEEEYGRRPIGAFKQWVNGIRDPYLNNVEIREKIQPLMKDTVAWWCMRMTL